jgi:tetrahydromethanopterin S-methyltransferase subunit F
VHDRPGVVAAVVGGGVALVARDVPLNLGLVVATVAGILAGLVAERWRR